jgi:phage-related protein
MDRKVILYKNANGKCLFEDFVFSLPPKVQKKITMNVQFLRETLILKEPYFKKLVNTSGIWEGRIHAGSDIFRYFFFFDDGNIVVLTHGFQKKTQKTPQNEIERAEEIKRDYLKRKK